MCLVLTVNCILCVCVCVCVLSMACKATAMIVLIVLSVVTLLVELTHHGSMMI